jgi:hypothetical protein
VSVEDGQYPFATGQVWAEPDIDHAVWYMRSLLEDPGYGRRLGALASRHIRTFHSYRACGIRYVNRLGEVA